MPSKMGGGLLAISTNGAVDVSGWLASGAAGLTTDGASWICDGGDSSDPSLVTWTSCKVTGSIPTKSPLWLGVNQGSLARSTRTSTVSQDGGDTSS